MGLAYAALVTAVVAWGLSFPVMRFAVGALGPFDVGLSRLVLAAAGSLGLLAWPGGAAGRPPLRVTWRRHAGRLAVLSLLVGYGQAFTLPYGLALTPAGVGSLIPPLNPIVTMLLAAWLLEETIAPRQWLGLALAVTGVVALALRDGLPTWASLAGPTILAVAPVSWAVYTVLSKPLLRDIAPMPLTALTLGGGLVSILPWAHLAAPRRLLQARPAEWAAVLFLGLVAMALAYGLWYVGLARIGAGATGSMTLGIPLVGVAGAWLLLGERLTPRVGLAAVLILGGLWLVLHPRHG